MLAPKKVKYRKIQKGNMRGMSNRSNFVAYGTFGLKALEPGRITSRQIEATRISISRRVRKTGRMWIRIFPDKPITKKPLEVRQGKGKGNVEYWVCPIKPGKILYEMEGVDEDLAKEAFALAAAKISVGTTFVKRT